jgi:hypothetical protein
VGTWQIVEMSHRGQPSPMPPGMTMTLTFAEGGSLSMTMSGGPAPAGQSRQGSWSLSGNQITVTMENDTKTGSLTFEGPDRAILDLEEAKMTLSRSSG